jgi:hypothetical protein
MTKIRLNNEAIEYVTGETSDSRVNAIMFCKKFVIPLATSNHTSFLGTLVRLTSGNSE